MSAAPQELFLITYLRDGLLRRDRWFHQPEEAQHHLSYLQQLFPDAGVKLHVIPYSTADATSGGAGAYHQF
ncbi:MAG: hypothetical protein CVV27_17820 [Candidatus Melainabacteria bacterium HGW-Melainabacteria-1]|nr:MAG: hypothetical protein CVV27_17820 [Candidatus Melainabacteria bacterium HGW-Melainabacteria-1]